MYFSTESDPDKITTESLLAPKLLGGSMEYDIDLSKVECGCDTAVYLVGGPAMDSDGSKAASDGFGYCDANKVGGYWCPEYDIMEANKYAFRSTVHLCSNPNSKGFISECDRGGVDTLD